MPFSMHGRWHLRVSKAIHTWENRFVVAGASVGNGNYPPTVGTEVEVDGLPDWELRAEHINPATPGVWQPSDMTIVNRVQSGADLYYLIGAEDPLPRRDFEDIQWDANFLGSMIEIPYRPFAVHTGDLFQMPDGIFETALGIYYMGVRVTNTWGEALTYADVLDVSGTGRADLAARGIHIIDAWSSQELQALRQQPHQTPYGTGVHLGPLEPGESRTVYFKVDVSAAAPRKHFVDFVCLNMVHTPDPDNPKRHVRKPIFVSRSYVDQTTGEIVSTVAQGTLRMKLREVALDEAGARRARRRKPKTKLPADAPSTEELRNLLDAILKGKRVDPCLVQKVWNCYCACRDLPTDGTGLPPSDGRFIYDPFFIFPTRFSYTVTPHTPYEGQHGPIPFDDPWWKVLLLIIAIILLIAGALSEASDVAYHDEDLIIGQLDRWQQNDLDAALTMLDGSRTVPTPTMQVLDAQTGELNTTPVGTLDTILSLTGPPLTAAEVTALLPLAMTDPRRRVFKSGARTGLTHGIITGFSTFTRTSDGTVFSIPQVRVGMDPRPAFAMSVSDRGDSGSVWVQTTTMRPVALHHSGNDPGTSGSGSLLADVASILGVTFS